MWKNPWVLRCDARQAASIPDLSDPSIHQWLVVDERNTPNFLCYQCQILSWSDSFIFRSVQMLQKNNIKKVQTVKGKFKKTFTRMHRKCISKAPQHWQHHHAGAKECHSTCYIMWCLPDKLVNGAASNLTCRVQGVLRGILMLKPMDGVGGSHLKNRPSNFGESKYIRIYNL